MVYKINKKNIEQTDQIKRKNYNNKELQVVNKVKDKEYKALIKRYNKILFIIHEKKEEDMITIDLFPLEILFKLFDLLDRETKLIASNVCIR